MAVAAPGASSGTGMVMGETTMNEQAAITVGVMRRKKKKANDSL